MFYQLSLFSNCREVRLLWKSPVTAYSILVFAICSCLVSSVRPSLKRLMTRLNRHRSEINSFSSTASFSNLCGFIPYNLSSLTKVIEYRLIWELMIIKSDLYLCCRLSLATICRSEIAVDSTWKQAYHNRDTLHLNLWILAVGSTVNIFLKVIICFFVC